MSLTPELRNIVVDLEAKIEDKTYSVHARDVFAAIKDCIVTHKPIDKELQDAYVSAVANNQAVNRYGQ